MTSAIAAIPGLPGAQTSASTPGSDRSLTTSACSRAPDRSRELSCLVRVRDEAKVHNDRESGAYFVDRNVD
jgi:hypothetical protein